MRNKIPNKFCNTKILDAFLIQFGGILPLWTGLTVPKGVDRYNNQPAESAMNVSKRLLNEKQLEIGANKVKATRFVKLMTFRVIGCAKRYLIKLPRKRLNYGKKKQKKDNDDSKVTKKIAVHMKKVSAKSTSSKQQQAIDLSTSQEAMDLSSQSSSHDTSCTSLKHSQESWDKPKKKKKTFSYFQKKSILLRGEEPIEAQKKGKNSSGTTAVLSKKNSSSEPINVQETVSAQV